MYICVCSKTTLLDFVSGVPFVILIVKSCFFNIFHVCFLTFGTEFYQVIYTI